MGPTYAIDAEVFFDVGIFTAAERMHSIKFVNSWRDCNVTTGTLQGWKLKLGIFKWNTLKYYGF